MAASKKTTRWGILACGNIAKKFAKDIPFAKGAELIACGSRTEGKAEAFGEEFDIPRRYHNYQDLLADADVDAIYVASPHTGHCEHTMRAMRAGKAVLCEKPLAVNRQQVQQMIDCARAEKVFLMEAMWTRFLPVIAQARKLLAEGAIGELRCVQANFGFRCGGDPEHRLMNPDLAGGGLLDVGIYPISLAHMLFGQPDQVTGAAELGDTGVDVQAGVVLKWQAGPIAILGCGVRTHMDHDAVIYGTDGVMRIPDFWHATHLEYGPRGGEPRKIEPEFAGHGFNYEIEEVQACLRAGKTESDVMPLAASLEIMAVMDELRCQWGVVYPFERQ